LCLEQQWITVSGKHKDAAGKAQRLDAQTELSVGYVAIGIKYAYDGEHSHDGLTGWVTFVG
jgi:hypothetical protein